MRGLGILRYLFDSVALAIDRVSQISDFESVLSVNERIRHPLLFFWLVDKGILIKDIYHLANQ